MRRVFLFIARALISLPFVFDTVGGVLNWSSTLAALDEALCRWLIYVEHFRSAGFVGDMLQYGISKAPFVMGAVLLLEGVGGGLVLIAKRTTRFGISLLLLFSLFTMLIFHPFWLEIGENFHIQLMLFLKNISIVGLSLYLLIVLQKEKPTA